jgi:ribokinase
MSESRNAPELITIGHVLADIRMFVNEFPKPDEEARTNALNVGGGGSAANVAVGASRLGVKSGFIGSIGFDTFGRVLLEEFEHEGVDISHVKVNTNTDSGMTLIAVNKKGQVMMFGFLGASDMLFPTDMDEKYLSSTEHIHLTGLSFETAVKAAQIANRANVVLSFDPGRLMSGFGLEKLSTLLKFVNQILLNQEESEKLTGSNNLDHAADVLLKKGPELVIIKRGPDGVYVATTERKMQCPAYEVKVIDTTGAGDAFSSGFITAQLEGKNLDDSVKFANATASLKITKSGARALPTRKTVERFLRETEIEQK